MIDINCDMGEGVLGEEALMPYVTSVNIACGGHTGDEASMQATVELARRYGLRVGAHPSFPDRENFGRSEMHLPLDEVECAVYEQCRALATELTHVKPHGALYNQAAKDPALAKAIARGVARLSRSVALVGLAGSVMLDAFREEGFETIAEAFADRRYEPDGTLRSRKLPGALIDNPAEAAEQALMIAKKSLAQTICIHSDTPGALPIAIAVRHALSSKGYATHFAVPSTRPDALGGNR